MEARLRLVDDAGNPLSRGLVGGFFSFITDGSVHDEIDFELLSNDADDNNERVLTNAFDDDDFSQAGDLQFVTQTGLDPTGFNTYRIHWLPDRIQWFVNDQLMREEFDTVPDQPMNVHLNLWAPNANFADAFDAGLQPADNAGNNQTFFMEVDFVEVSRMFAVDVSQITVEALKGPTGEPLNSSQIVISYRNGALGSVADPSQIAVTAQALDPVGGTVPIDIGIQQAFVDTQDSHNLILITNVLVPEGATLSIGSGALTKQFGSPLDAQTLTLRDGVDPFAFTMANRPFTPTDLSIFGADPDNPPEVQDQPISEAEAFQKFDTFMQRARNKGIITEAGYQEALQLVNSDAMKAKIPDDFNLRVALASLKISKFAESAITTILFGVNEQGLPIFRRVAFDPSVPADNIAVSHTNELGTKDILIHPDYVGASIELGPTLIHEALRQDSKKNDQPANGQPEEVITNTAETMGWFEYVLIDPGLAHQNTELVTGHNSELFAFLESGAAGFPNPGIKTAPVENAGISFENLQRLINDGLEDVTTPGNNLLNAYIHAVTGRPTDPPGNFDFSNETLAYLDSQRLFDAEEALIAANVLKLTIQH
jgi:hypothetical protein